MKKVMSRMLSKANRKLNSLERKLTYDKNDPKNIFAERASKWFKDDGDSTLRLNYNLDSNALVLDLGGYKGQWASDIYSMYNCRILIFEPFLPFAEKIEKRFEKNENISVYKFGLGAKTEEAKLSILDEASSIHNKNGRQTEEVLIVSIVDFLKDNHITSVDLIKINIEGAEYDLLETLIDKGYIKHFKNIQVQFHDFVINNAAERMKSIQKKLALTHRLTYHYEFIWDNWELRQDDQTSLS